MKISVLASGSKGNVSYISSSTTRLLIDLGISCLSIEKKLNEIEVNPKSIDAIIVTHTHADHINGLKTFIKKYNPKIYLSKKMLHDLNLQFIVDNYEIIKNDFTINDIDIKIIKTSHDTSDSNGYIFEKGDKSIVYVTDTGYINAKNFEKMTNKNIYVMESNHDIEMLMNGSYPYYLKQRVLGDRGHLSNKDSAFYLSKFIGDETKKIILIHISKENNTPDIALSTLKNTLRDSEINFDNIIISSQNERTELIKL